MTLSEGEDHVHAEAEAVTDDPWDQDRARDQDRVASENKMTVLSLTHDLSPTAAARPMEYHAASLGALRIDHHLESHENVRQYEQGRPRLLL